MSSPLNEYKRFIDDLVKIRTSILARQVMDEGLPALPVNKEINQLLSQLSLEQRETLAKIIQKERDGGIHDTLAYMSDAINLNGLRLSRNGTEIAIEPYGTEMYYDWVCRYMGDEWPEHQLKEQYRSNSKE